jgi:hypothetical protein
MVYIIFNEHYKKEIEVEIKRISAITGIEHIRNIPVNPEDYISWKKNACSIDDAMPYLNNDDREFMLSGITKEEWVSAFNGALAL